MSTTATLPLPLALTPAQPVEGPCSLDELHYREYTAVYTKYNPQTQVRETSDGLPVLPRMVETDTLDKDTWDTYYDDDE
jgi:hypothetical protein